MLRCAFDKKVSGMCLAYAVILSLVLSTPGYAQSDTVQTDVPALKDVYSGDFNIGCLLSYRNIGLPDDPPVPGQSAVVTPNGGYLIRFHMNSMSPGNNMKPQYTVDISGSASAYSAASTQADKDSIDIHPIVRFNGDMIAQLNWAQRQGFTFRGHTLVWHNQTPAEFFRSGYTGAGARLTKERMTERMDNYIGEVIRLIHEGWPGLLSAMDVVNEAIDDGTGTVRTSGNDWYATFGDTTYIMKAFEFARKYTEQYGESQIKLYYNDYNTSSAQKADGIVALLTPIFQAGYLDGIGMQEHDGFSSPTAAAWIASYNKFEPICSEMAVTELDVTTGSASPSSAARMKQANQYGQLFKCFVERSFKSGRGKIISVSKDGLNDQYTFKSNQASSLWDADNQCKPAFYAVVGVGVNFNALDSLRSYAGTLQANQYTQESWSRLDSAMLLAASAMDSNYTFNESAADTLGAARDSLKAAIDGLVEIPTAVFAPDGNVPKNYGLNQNYPNPFNPTTAVSYRLPVVSHVTLRVYDVLGREVATLVDARQSAGTHSVTFNATGLQSGAYFCRLDAGSYSETIKLILLK